MGNKSKKLFTKQRGGGHLLLNYKGANNAVSFYNSIIFVLVGGYIGMIL